MNILFHICIFSAACCTHACVGWSSSRLYVLSECLEDCFPGTMWHSAALMHEMVPRRHSFGWLRLPNEFVSISSNQLFSSKASVGLCSWYTNKYATRMNFSIRTSTRQLLKVGAGYIAFVACTRVTPFASRLPHKTSKREI
ncbi:hypothetical protein C8R43DRAFT_253387 [Mycena crocata]|nr:hypothetical protein C8R43DRAFT_253387 [Mycena crocata]